MADKKISQLGAVATPLVGTEEVPVVQSSTTKKATVQDFLVVGNGTATLGGIINGVASGTNAGVYQLLQNGGTSTIGMGNKSSLIGGAYSAIPVFYFNGQADFYDNTTLRGRWDSSGNFAVANGNFVPSTAAKGVNFTANTPAAGMTSQLLNWYEEGTWTPVVTSGSGTITSYTSSGNYTRVGNTITIFANINVTNSGSASGNLNFSGLPYTSKNVGTYITTVLAREDNVTGVNFTVIFAGNNTTGIILSANWTNNVLYLFSATYLVA